MLTHVVCTITNTATTVIFLLCTIKLKHSFCTQGMGDHQQYPQTSTQQQVGVCMFGFVVGWVGDIQQALLLFYRYNTSHRNFQKENRRYVADFCFMYLKSSAITNSKVQQFLLINTLLHFSSLPNWMANWMANWMPGYYRLRHHCGMNL